MEAKQSIILNWLINKLGLRMAKQIVCLILLAFGIPRKIIIEQLGVSKNTLGKYDKALENADLTPILEANLYKPTSELDKYTDLIEKTIEERNPKSRREVQDIIKEKTGIVISLNRVGVWLKKRG